MSGESGGVEVKVRSQLSKIVEDLQAIQRQAQSVSDELKSTGTNVGKEVEGQTNKVKNALNEMQNFGRRVADQLKRDFSTLGSLQSLSSGIALGGQLTGSIKESIKLSDTISRLGSIFGIARTDFSSFQSQMTQGLAEIGASSESAANALSGLAETPVKGRKNLLEYSRTAAELASISGQKGQEGTIAKGAAGVITARGGNPNDTNQLGDLTKEILQIRKATGGSVTDIISALKDIYSKTNADFQKSLKGGGSTSLATGALLGGPEATTFLEKFMGMNRIERKGLEAQGFGQIISKNGELNTKAILSTLAEAKGRGMGDAQAGLKTYGFSDDEAKGFIRLAEAVKTNGDVINNARNQMVNLNDEYRQSMSLGDAFKSNINKVKGNVSKVGETFLDAIQGASKSVGLEDQFSKVRPYLGAQGAQKGLGEASQSNVGSAAVVGGAALAAALLAGAGIKGIGSGLLGTLGGEAKAKAIEAATGEKVQRVEVINFPRDQGSADFLKKMEQLAGGGAVAGAGGGSTMGAFAAAAVPALASTALISDISDTMGSRTNLTENTERLSRTKGEGPSEQETQAISAIGEKIAAAISGFFSGKSTQNSSPMTKDVRVVIDMKNKDLKAATLPGRGRSN